MRIRSSDTLKTGFNYYAYADTDYRLTLLCPAPSSGFAATNITGTSATLNWNVVDCAKGYKLQYKVKGTHAWTTVNTSTNIFSVGLTGLTANKTYQWHVATKCKPSTVVFSYYSANKNFTTASAFADNNLNVDNISAQTKASSITVYPNPANNNAFIQFTSNKTGKYTVELTDVSGKVLQTKSGTAVVGKNSVTIDVTKYAQGMYMINVTDDEHGKRTLKLNKE